MSHPLIELAGLSHSYGHLVALDGLTEPVAYVDGPRAKQAFAAALDRVLAGKRRGW